MMSTDEDPTSAESDNMPARTRVSRRASLDLKDQAMFASRNVRRLSMEMQNFLDDNAGPIQTSIDEDCEVNAMQLQPPSTIQFDMGDQEKKGRDVFSKRMSDSMRHLQSCMEEMERLNAKNSSDERSAGFRISAPNIPSDVSKSMRKLQLSMEEMEKLNEENAKEIQVKSHKRTASLSERFSKAVEASPTAQGVLNRLRRFSRSVSIDTDSSRRSSDCSINIDLQYQTDQERDAALESLKKEAYEACLDAIRQHLFAFLAESPNVTYEDWIEELHPENAKSMRNIVQGKRIDHRFYMPDSDHRQLWNENLGGERNFVPVRKYNPDDHLLATPKLEKASKDFPPGPKE